jgi:hypothetical protein
MLDFLVENKYVYAIATIFVILYASQVGPKLPDYMVRLFDNNLFKMLILFLIVVRAKKDPAFSIILAVAFVIITDYIRTNMLKETFGEQKEEKAYVEENGKINLNPEKCNQALNELAQLNAEIEGISNSCLSLPDNVKDVCFKEVEKMKEKAVSYSELYRNTCMKK